MAKLILVIPGPCHSMRVVTLCLPEDRRGPCGLSVGSLEQNLPS